MRKNKNSIKYPSYILLAKYESPKCNIDEQGKICYNINIEIILKRGNEYADF